VSPPGYLLGCVHTRTLHIHPHRGHPGEEGPGPHLSKKHRGSTAPLLRRHYPPSLLIRAAPTPQARIPHRLVWLPRRFGDAPGVSHGSRRTPSPHAVPVTPGSRPAPTARTSGPGYSLFPGPSSRTRVSCPAAGRSSLRHWNRGSALPIPSPGREGRGLDATSGFTRVTACGFALESLRFLCREASTNMDCSI
jgi:hypothetical protein